METPILNHVLVQLQAALERDDLIGAANIIEALRPPDQAELFYELDEEDRVALLPGLILLTRLIFWKRRLGGQTQE
ncbi:MAG: hypothetical protein HC875_41330 [Anaerolineales bacterium]|nr:hypothetical protein [Anaerolineales bacterium]